MTTKTIPYDVAEQLRTPTEIAAYLSAWLIEAPEDKVGIVRALRDVARAQWLAGCGASNAEAPADHGQ